MDAFTLNAPGRRKALRPEFPKVPIAFGAKAFVLNHLQPVSSSGTPAVRVNLVARVIPDIRQRIVDPAHAGKRKARPAIIDQSAY